MHETDENDETDELYEIDKLVETEGIKVGKNMNMKMTKLNEKMTLMNLMKLMIWNT